MAWLASLLFRASSLAQAECPLTLPTCNSTAQSHRSNVNATAIGLLMGNGRLLQQQRCTERDLPNILQPIRASVGPAMNGNNDKHKTEHIDFYDLASSVVIGALVAAAVKQVANEDHPTRLGTKRT
ncbi:hypothetical protein E4U39_000760 [Claviceps sp. Clav50 group G5]|nr:hypothetical protein E4U39_000760 [Claviceps sp. Clav50 group G5]